MTWAELSWADLSLGEFVRNSPAAFDPCLAENKMPCPLLIFSQSDYLIQVVDTNTNTELKTMQIQISWLLQNPTDLDLHCLQRQYISGFSRTRVKTHPEVVKWTN